LGWVVVRVFRVVRVPWVETRITHNNFGYRELKPELVFGFFGLGFFGFGLGFFGFGVRVSGILPSHTCVSLQARLRFLGSPPVFERMVGAGAHSSSYMIPQCF